MKILLLVLLVFLFSIIDGFSQNWLVQQTGTNIFFKACYFLDANTGYVAGNSAMFKTTNGGINWFQQTLPVGGEDMSIYFMDNSTGFATCSYYILKTTDGGNTWAQNYFATTLYLLFGISFFNSNTGCVVGEDMSANLRTIRTPDCGGNWNFINNSGSDWRITSIYTIPNTGTGYFVTTGGPIKKTVNYGSNWNYVYTHGGIVFWSVHFENVNTGFAVGNYSSSPFYNIFFKTTNGGTNWDSSGCGGFLAKTIYFTSVNTGYIGCDSGKILTTTNSGLNWNTQTYTSKNIKSMFFPSAQTGYAVGDSGLILKTTNGGGLTFEGNIQTKIPDKYFLFQNYPNPFNPSTNIRYQIPNNSFVSLCIYDVLGSVIATLVNEQLKAGTYQVDWDGSSYASGVYYYRLVTDNFSETKKMLMIK